MATAAFTRTSTAVVQVDADLSWVAAYSGNSGSVTLTMPRTSRAASSLYINPDGGSSVAVLDETAGAWQGLIGGVEEDGASVTVTAYQYAAVLARRALSRRTTVRMATAGSIVSMALNEAVPGIRGARLGADWFAGSTIIPEYTFDGQNALDVVVDMMQASGGELHVTPAGVMWWCGPFAFATRHEPRLIADGNFADVRHSVDPLSRISEVTAVNPAGAFYTARDGTAAADGWPGQTTITVDATGTGLVGAALAELEQRSRPIVTIEGSVGPELWGIHERDYVTVLIPWAGFSGRTYQCRVLARRLGAGDARMRLVLQVIPNMIGSSLTAGAGARIRPSMRVSRDGGAGSFVQRQRLQARRLAALERGA